MKGHFYLHAFWSIGINRQTMTHSCVLGRHLQHPLIDQIDETISNLPIHLVRYGAANIHINTGIVESRTLVLGVFSRKEGYLTGSRGNLI